jgi:6-pyruvoyltetrahydropterin/6-carboxytetrahydropterin synthase
MLLFIDFSFDAAHYLTKVPAGHKCAVMHGHTYHLRIWINGPIDEQGWVMDFAAIKQKAATVIDVVDHHCLNTVEGLENPTCELFAVWLWIKLKKEIPLLHKITLQETPTSGVEYAGE